jgi:cob(I)alamin adenosyltransferase
LNLDTVLPVLRKRRSKLHVVIAGRYAPFELTDFADIVTEMRQIKHPHPASKIPPQAGSVIVLAVGLLTLALRRPEPTGTK